MKENIKMKNKVQNLETLVQTKFLSLYNANYTNKDGNKKTWTIATRKSKEALEEQFFNGKEDKVDAVVILAYHKDEKKLVAIKQFRIPLNNYVYELPAGLIDNNDDIISTVKRELKEETGLDLEEVIEDRIGSHLKKRKEPKLFLSLLYCLLLQLFLCNSPPFQSQTCENKFSKSKVDLQYCASFRCIAG